MLEVVEPAFRWVPEHVSTAGPEVADLARAIGLPLDPEQELCLDDMYAERADGRLAALEFAVIAPRQNIKTHLFKAAAWGDLLLFDQNLVVWTAHEFNTAMEAFRDMCELVDGSPLISKRVKKIVNANGDEGIEFHTGQRLRFKARTKGGGRGITGDRVILDEAFALQAAHLGSLLPTMAAKSVEGDPQIRYGSSAGLVGSEMLRRLRDRGRPGGDPALAWVEWCAGLVECAIPACDHQFGVAGCALDDRSLWQAANLALHRRIDIEFVATMRRSLPPEEFAREFLGWWDEPLEAGATIPAHLWAECGDRKANPVEPVSLAVDVAPGHSSGAVVACGEVVYVAEHGAGISWIPSKVASLVASKQVSAVGVDTSSPAAALIPELEKPVAEGGAGLTIHSAKNPNGKLVLLTGRDMSSACEQILAAVMEGKFRHRDQAVLNTAVDSAYRRQVGDSFKWSRRDSSVDISALVAATEAWFLWNATDRTKPVVAMILGGDS